VSNTIRHRHVAAIRDCVAALDCLQESC
jgi:hypothetical protein